MNEHKDLEGIKKLIQKPQYNEKIGNRYQRQQLLGKGGMAEVYCAYDTKLERLVALKLLHNEKPYT